MGAWGTAIFADDLACDIRDDYRELLADQVPDEEATRRVIAEYDYLDDDESHTLWLALAAAQSQLGRLDENVKARALQVIESGDGLELWAEAGPTDLAKRQAVLAKLRDKLVGPQPRPRAVRRPWRDVTDLEAGDVLAFPASDSLALLRVQRIDDQRVGVAPIIEWLEWKSHKVPSARKIRRLKVRQRKQEFTGQVLTETFRVVRHRKKDPDWASLGFELVAHVQPRPTDINASASIYCAWTGLAKRLERGRA